MTLMPLTVVNDSSVARADPFTVTELMPKTLVNQVAAGVRDPQTGVTVLERMRAKILVEGSEKGAEEEAKKISKRVASGSSVPIGALGTGSDYTPFLQHLGIASLDQLGALKTSALSGATMTGLSLGLTRNVTTADWLRANSAPNLWPVEGPVTGSFGERIDPFNGEGAFHSGIDIGSTDGQPVLAPADGTVVFADFLGGYGRAVTIDHGHGITTRYGHLANFAVMPGQHVHRGDTIGHVGESGRSTGPHLHYEVRINDTPVNPHKYLRLTVANVGGFSAGS